MPRWALRAVPLHGDFSPENVIVDGLQITAIDFDVSGGAVGTRFHDLASLYVSFERMKARPFGDPAFVAELQRTLLASFEVGLTEEAPLFRLALMDRVARHLATRAPWSRGLCRRWLEG